MKNFLLGSFSTIIFSLFLRGCLEGVRYGSSVRS